MHQLLLLGPLVLVAWSVDVSSDDEFDFDRRPRRPAPIPDDFEGLPNSEPALQSGRPPSRRAPRERYRQRGTEPSPTRRQSWDAPIGTADLPEPPPLKYVFTGYRGAFSVIGGAGQAAYQRERQPYLIGLRYLRRDERFSYWLASAGDPTVREWAFSRRAGPDGRHTVWQRTNRGWQYFDLAQVSKPR
ncbi:MAG TPA: hypothetical protein VJ783_05465 [Pirellulales bacterium]|nr:hypothetical protein [Pirellulales bacterium]